MLLGALLPAIAWSAVPVSWNPTVRVRLCANQSLEQVTLEGYGGLRVSGQRAQGRVTVSVLHDRLEIKDGARLSLVLPSATIASREGRWIDVRLSNGKVKRTVGWLSFSVEKGRLQIIDAVPLETYVLGVVNGELGSLAFNPESLKAQIVASRSYVLATRGRHQGFDFCDTPHCQVYDGTGSIRHDFKLAMQASRGQFLAYRGKPIPAFYHDSCGGKTAAIQTVWKAPRIPYLQSVQDGKDDAYCKTAPTASWTFWARRSDLRECFARKGWIQGFDALDALRVVRLDDSDRARFVLIQTQNPRWLPASDIRRAMIRYFGKEVLKSTVFTVVREGDGFRFEGRGWGHGVGLCQWGAIEMGKEGKSYRDILAHYYPGTEIERLPEPLYVSIDRDGAVQ